MNGDLDTALDGCVAAKALELPVFPKAVREVVAIVDREDVDARQLADVIRRDPTLAAHLLRIANSPLFASRAPIVSLQQALARLGTAQIRQIAVLVACETRAFVLRGRENVGKELLRHAVASAIFAQEIARLRRHNVEEAFLAGLLHDVGAPAVHQRIADLENERGKRYPDADVARAVDRLHGAIGREIAERWGLPPRLCAAIGDHHGVVTEGSGHEALRATVQLADALTHELLDETEMQDVVREAAAVLNLYPEDLDGLRARRDLVLEFLGGLS